MNLNTKVNLFLGIHAQLKVFHWQTKGYSRHNAFAQTRDELEELMDTFIEESMGKYGRFSLDNETKNIELFNLSELKPVEMVETICQSFIGFTDELDPVDTNLLNIRDEMLGLFQKLKYLLTLE
jgi:DNA-binding ferritin-like protein